LTQEEFCKYYKTISNADLLAILNNPEDYQSEALQAAKNEFTNRQIPENEIQAAAVIDANQKKEKELQKEKIRLVESKVKSAGTSLMETLNPIQSGIQTNEKIIRFIVVVFSLLYLYFLVTNFRAIHSYIDDFRLSPVAAFLELLPFWYLPLAIFLFWKRKQSGWILMAINLCAASVMIIGMFWKDINYKPSAFTFFTPETYSPIYYVTQIIFAGGSLFAICRTGIRSSFSVSQDKMTAVLIITGILSALLVIA
jgi:hypothetical protein